MALPTAAPAQRDTDLLGAHAVCSHNGAFWIIISDFNDLLFSVCLCVATCSCSQKQEAQNPRATVTEGCELLTDAGRPPVHPGHDDSTLTVTGCYGVFKDTVTLMKSPDG